MLHPFMPYVTDAIYEYLPVKEENIMVSTYPIYDKTLVFNEEEANVDEIIEFIKNFRNTLKENNITSKYNVLINFDEKLIIKTLKLQEKIISEELDITAFKVNTKNYEAVIYYEKEITEEDIKLKEKRIEELKASISKRENLLSPLLLCVFSINMFKRDVKNNSPTFNKTILYLYNMLVLLF